MEQWHRPRQRCVGLNELSGITQVVPIDVYDQDGVRVRVDREQYGLRAVCEPCGAYRIHAFSAKNFRVFGKAEYLAHARQAPAKKRTYGTSRPAYHFAYGVFLAR